MTIKNYIGLFLIVLPFIIIFIKAIIDLGFLVTLFIILSIALTAGLFSLGIKLLHE